MIMYDIQLQEQLAAAKLVHKKGTGPHVPKNRISWTSLEEIRSVVQTDLTKQQEMRIVEIVDLIELLTNHNVSEQVKFYMMQRTVATCPKMNMDCWRKRIPSLIDFGNQITIIHKSYFGWEILPHILPSSEEKAESHQLFQLTAANNGKLPMSMYIKLDHIFLGVMVAKDGVLIIQEPNKLFDECHKTKLPSVIG